MAKSKVNILVYNQGRFMGYIKSVSYSRNTFRTTLDIKDAKGYTSIDHIHSEIDFLARIGAHRGYVFTYN